MADDTTCCVCGRENLMESERKLLKLTTEELAFAIVNTASEPPEHYAYCKPCFRILQNPLAGAELLKGSFLFNLREAGVPNADELADRYFKMLIKRTAGKGLLS